MRLSSCFLLVFWVICLEKSSGRIYRPLKFVLYSFSLCWSSSAACLWLHSFLSFFSPWGIRAIHQKDQTHQATFFIVLFLLTSVHQFHLWSICQCLQRPHFSTLNFLWADSWRRLLWNGYFSDWTSQNYLNMWYSLNYAFFDDSWSNLWTE